MPPNDGMESAARTSAPSAALLSYQARLLENPPLSRTSSLSRSNSQTPGILAPSGIRRWNPSHRSVASTDSARDRAKHSSVEGKCASKFCDRARSPWSPAPIDMPLLLSTPSRTLYGLLKVFPQCHELTTNIGIHSLLRHRQILSRHQTDPRRYQRVEQTSHYQWNPQNPEFHSSVRLFHRNTTP